MRDCTINHHDNSADLASRSHGTYVWARVCTCVCTYVCRCIKKKLNPEYLSHGSAPQVVLRFLSQQRREGWGEEEEGRMGEEGEVSDGGERK